MTYQPGESERHAGRDVEKRANMAGVLYWLLSVALGLYRGSDIDYPPREIKSPRHVFERFVADFPFGHIGVDSGQ